METKKTLRIVRQHSHGSDTPSTEDRKNLDKLGAIPPYTLIVENFPTHDDVVELILCTQPDSWIMSVNMGISVVHWKDQFSRKDGLKLAGSRLKEVQLKVVSASFLDDGDINISAVLDDHVLIGFVVGNDGRAFVSHTIDPRHVYFHLYGDVSTESV